MSATNRVSARRSYDSGNPLRDISPRSSSSRVGSRNPSVVTSSTRGCSGQRDSSAWRSRATVDFPTATDPATPITNGVPDWDPFSPRNVFSALRRPSVAPTYRFSSRDSGR